MKVAIATSRKVGNTGLFSSRIHLLFSPSSVLQAMCGVPNQQGNCMKKKTFFGNISLEEYETMVTEEKEKSFSHSQFSVPTITLKILREGIKDINDVELFSHLPYLSSKSINEDGNIVALFKSDKEWVFSIFPDFILLNYIADNYTFTEKGIFIGRISQETFHIITTVTENNEAKSSLPTVVIDLFLNGLKDFRWGKNPKKQLLDLLDPTIPLVKEFC